MKGYKTNSGKIAVIDSNGNKRIWSTNGPIRGHGEANAYEAPCRTCKGDGRSYSDISEDWGRCGDCGGKGYNYLNADQVELER